MKSNGSDTPQHARLSGHKAGESNSAARQGEDVQSHEPLAIPDDAEGADWDFLRWLQDRFIGENIKVKHHDNRAAANVRADDADDKDTSWLSRVEEAQANLKEEPPESENGKGLFDEEVEENYFPDAATESLWLSCVYGDIEATRGALEAGAQVNFTHPKYHERTPLHYAACAIGVDDSAVRMLIEAGAHVNAADDVGCRPLHFAAESWDPDKVRALVKAGAEPHHENAHGYTPFQIARHLYDFCKDPSLEPNPDYDPEWEGEMMKLLDYEGSAPYPTLWPLHSEEIKKGQEGAK